MTTPAERLTGAEIDRIAGDWLARADAAALTPAEQADLDAWLAAEARHLGAYIRLRAASHRLDRLAALRTGQAEAPPSPSAAPGRRRVIAAAAAVLVLAGGGAALWAVQQPRTYHTGVGEMRRVTLSDGSVVALNTDSVLRVAYSKDRREIWLRRGEGHFIVAKNRDRPFVVHAEGASVTAVGTAFSVRAVGRAPVRVTVTEGVVAVKPPGLQTPKYVEALQEAAIAPTRAPPRIGAVSAGEINRRLAWTDGRIILAGQTLGEAAAEFNRYNDRKLVVAPEAAGARVGGVFRTSEVEAFARTAAPSLGLTVRVEPGGDIVMAE